MPDDEKEEVNVFLNYEKIAWNEKKISELENELKRVEIIATAKAVVVPEGKGIFWTNKIAELQTKQQLITGELQNLNIWRRKHLGKYNALKEALRELLEWWKKPEFAQDIDTFRENREKKFKELMKKLSGGKKPKGKESQTVLQSGGAYLPTFSGDRKGKDEKYEL